jgi:hypothetical protein
MLMKLLSALKKEHKKFAFYCSTASVFCWIWSSALAFLVSKKIESLSWVSGKPDWAFEV